MLGNIIVKDIKYVSEKGIINSKVLILSFLMQ